MSSPSINSFGQNFGPSLIATFLSAILYGITVIQTVYYYSRYDGDRGSWKILVGAVFTLDTAAMGLWMYCMYYYLVTSWGLPEKTAVDVREFPTEYVVTTLIAFLVQCFYINTIRALEAPIAVTFVLLALCITALATGLILPGVQIRLHFIENIVVSRLNHLAFDIARCTALACDVGVVAALCWLLRQRKNGVQQRSINMINSLMVFAVQRGVLQAFIQAGEVMAYAIQPSGVLFLPFHVLVSRIYCTSFLATLNSREYIARRGAPDQQLPTTTAPIFTSYLDPPFLFQTETQMQQSQQYQHQTRGQTVTFEIGRENRSAMRWNTRDLTGSAGKAESEGSDSGDMMEMEQTRKK